MKRNQRGLRCVAAAVFALLPIYAQAFAHKSGAWANAQFAAATKLQEELQSQPAEKRSSRDYEHVINAYRRIYSAAPNSTKADPSVVASAQLMEEAGRLLHDDDLLRSAIDQYEFLRREYPGSKARFNALFRIGEIYQDDLHDKEKADAAFQEFLKRYPRNPLADSAREELATPVQSAASKTKAAAKPWEVQDSSEAKSAGEERSAKDTHSPDDDSAAETAPTKAAAKLSRVTGVRHWSTPDYTRVAIDLDRVVKYDAQRIGEPDRVFFDFYDTKLNHKLVGRSFEVEDGFLRKIRVSQFKPGQSRVVLELDAFTDYQASLQSNPPRLVVEIRNRRAAEASESKVQAAKQPKNEETLTPRAADCASCSKKEDGDSQDVAPKQQATEDQPEAEKPTSRTTIVRSNGLKKTIVYADDEDQKLAKLEPPEIKPNAEASDARAPLPEKRSAKKSHRQSTDQPDVREAQPTAAGDRSLIRALGLKIGKIVIDPGHGGHDTGTIGPDGLEEKDLVLDVSLRLGKLLSNRLGAKVIYTRKDDTFIPLEERTAIANQEGADLFISIHANSSHDPDARGVETYYLNFSSSPDALEVAARENAVSEKSIHELQDLVKKIALKEKIEESHEFAADVETALHSGLAAKNPGERNRGVKKAPFIVLIGANMPSILAEISFLSNPGDERRLEKPEYRQRIAESLYRGISKYVGGLSGVKVASKIDKDEGQ